MSAAKHTPGPWKLDEDDGMIHAVGGAAIAHVYGPDEFPCLDPEEDDIEAIRAEQEANARLIAAVPRLLELLKRRNERGHSNACALVLRHHGRGRPIPPCDCGHAEAEALLAELEGRS